MEGERAVKIIDDISRLINAFGGDCSEWHIGVATDLERELFARGIPLDYPWCVCRCAASAEEARAIVRGFMNLSCKGNLDGRDRVSVSAVYIFAYRQPDDRKPRAVNGETRF